MTEFRYDRCYCIFPMKPLIKKSWCVKEGQKSNFRRVENENGDK